ncbi:MAG: hypothetical protein MJZ33_07365 [Paludibacteraceae bacterium]|nr:hypothetical protein [Paludibacteraceae bacterium]
MARRLYIFLAILLLGSCALNKTKKDNVLFLSESDSIIFLNGYHSASLLLKQVSLFPDTVTLKSQYLIKGFWDAFSLNSKTLINKDDAEIILNGYYELLNKRKHKDFIEKENSLIKEFVENDSTPSLKNGIFYKIKKRGLGKTPSEKSHILIKYWGRDFRGNIFDQSPNSNAKWIAVEDFNNCLKETILLMPQGSIWQVIIPPHLFNTLSFSEDAKVLPYSALIYEFEMNNIKE